MATPTIDKNGFAYECPECCEEAMSWDAEKGKWVCSACGEEFEYQHIAFCEICGRPEQVVNSQVYQQSDPDDYNPFVCSFCREEQWDELQKTIMVPLATSAEC